MLDDLQKIHERDARDALGTATKQWQQLEHVYDLGGWQPRAEIRNIVHSGMGGSALSAMMSTSWPGYTVPFEVVRGYDVPAYVGPNTLFIAASYSGNTEETLAALGQAEAMGAQVAVITSGGKLAQIAQQKQHLLITLPAIGTPRYGTLYGLKALVTLGEHLGLLAQSGVAAELAEAASFVRASVEAWQPTVHTRDNPAKQLALELMGKAPVVYAGPLLTPAAHKWKISFNETAKNVAWECALPDFNHNEFTGWTAQPVEKQYAPIYLLSSSDNDRIQKRFSLSDKLLSGRWPSPERVQAGGDTPLQQLLWTVALGDFVSLYLAFLNGVSPIDVPDKDIVIRLKKELDA